MMKNIHGAQVGDIWCLNNYYHFLLLEHKERVDDTPEDAFHALCLDTGHYDAVYFSHHVKSISWEKVA